jgi:CSLREA domain-containing protein
MNFRRAKPSRKFLLLAGNFLLLFQAFTPALAQATLTVNTTNDVNDGTCNVTHCSLREAITAANANAATDTIAFNIPGSGVRTILPTSPLPIITHPVIIDGTTQPDFLGTPIIELDGTSAGASVNGLVIQAGSSTVRGLIINHFRQTGGGNNGNGIVLAVNGGNTIQGNYIGFDLDSLSQYSTRNDSSGILISTANNLIGGTIRVTEMSFRTT